MKQKSTTTYTVAFRRKREAKTDYKKRLKLLNSQKPRLVVRRSLHHTVAALNIYDPKGDVTKVQVSTKELAKQGWKCGTGNVPAAYLTGLLLGVKAKKAGITDAIVDLGLQQSKAGTRLYAVVAGVKAAGVEIPCDEAMLPAEDRVNGSHIQKYAESIKGDSEKFKKQFGKTADAVTITAQFDAVKAKING